MSQGEDGIHLLGTDNLGRDVAAGIVHGARIAFIISFTTIFLALFLGLLIGLITGYYGNNGIRKNVFQIILWIIMISFIGYYSLSLLMGGMDIYSTIPLILSFGLGYGIDKVLGKIPIKKIGIPLDLMIQRLFELRESIPGIFILLAMTSIITSPSVWTIAMLLTILFWMTFARHMRAETQAIKEEDYIQASRASGISEWRIMTRHILPNALPSIAVIIAFAFSSVILLESTLSFLGIGVPIEEVSWGKLLAEAKKTPKAWWLAVFPGIAIFSILLAFNTLGDAYSEHYSQ